MHGLSLNKHSRISPSCKPMSDDMGDMTESGNIMGRKGSRQSALTDMNSATSDTGNLLSSPPASRSADLSLCSWPWLGSRAGIQIPRY